MSSTLLAPQHLIPHQSPSWFVRVDGYGFELLVSSNCSTFNEVSHAVNYASYLFRQGRERPNERTELNQVRWKHYSGSADGRTSTARSVLLLAAKHLAEDWEDWACESVYLLPLRPMLATDRLPISAYRHVWDVLGELCADIGLDMSQDLWASHLDQETPPHVHRVRSRSRLSLYECIDEAVRTGALESLAGPLAPFITA